MPVMNFFKPIITFSFVLFVLHSFPIISADLEKELTDLSHWLEEMPGLKINGLNEKDKIILKRLEKLINTVKKYPHFIEQFTNMNAALLDWKKACPIFDPSLNGGKKISKADKRITESTKMETQHMIQPSSSKRTRNLKCPNKLDTEEHGNSGKTGGDNESKFETARRERSQTRYYDSDLQPIGLQNKSK